MSRTRRRPSGRGWWHWHKRLTSEFHLDQFADREKAKDVEGRGDLENTDAVGIVEKSVSIARLDDAECSEHQNRQQADDDSAHAGLRGEGADLLLEALTGADDFGETADDHGE